MTTDDESDDEEARDDDEIGDADSKDEQVEDDGEDESTNDGDESSALNQPEYSAEAQKDIDRTSNMRSARNDDSLDQGRHPFGVAVDHGRTDCDHVIGHRQVRSRRHHGHRRR